MFIGEWYHTIDSKGRLTVPSRLRDLLPDGGYLTRGFDRNLLLYRRKDFERLTTRVQQLTSTKPEHRHMLHPANALRPRWRAKVRRAIICAAGGCERQINQGKLLAVHF